MQDCILGPRQKEHFFFGGKCVLCGIKLPCCKFCRFSYDNGRDNGRLACGHGVDDAAIAAGDTSTNPIWAVRKYSLDGIRKMLATSGGLPEGFDDENLSPDDGQTCATFEWATEN